MTNSDVLKRFLDAGVAFTQMTRERAENLVRELVQVGAVRVDETQQAVQALVDRGRESTERLATLVSAEVRKQMDLVAARVDGLEERVEDVARRVRSAGKAAAGKAAAGKAPAKKAPAKKAPARKSTARKSTARKSTAKKSTAKKGTTKKAAAKKAPARKAATKRPAAKKAAG